MLRGLAAREGWQDVDDLAAAQDAVVAGLGSVDEEAGHPSDVRQFPAGREQRPQVAHGSRRPRRQPLLVAPRRAAGAGPVPDYEVAHTTEPATPPTPPGRAFIASRGRRPP